MKMKMVTVVGSCVCRDLFMDDEGNFEFCTDVRFSSPISMLANPVKSIVINFDNLNNKAMDVNGNWFKKTLINDINKTTFEALNERHGEYLITDLVEARMQIAEIMHPNELAPLVITNSGVFKKHYRYNLQKNILKDCSIKIINPSDIDESTWENTINTYIDRLLCLFDERKIILIKNMPAKYYVNQNGCLEHFSSPSHCSEIFESEYLLPKLYDMFLKRCSNAIVIEIPKYALGDSGHKWKTNPYHFTKNYYSYLLDCVKAITLKNDYHSLNDIYKKYSTIFEHDYWMAAKKTIKNTASAEEQPASYKDIINSVEEFSNIGRLKRAKILFACSKKEFFKYLFKLSKQ